LRLARDVLHTGLYAKPRSKPTEIGNDKEYIAQGGDNVSGMESTERQLSDGSSTRDIKFVNDLPGHIGLQIQAVYYRRTFILLQPLITSAALQPAGLQIFMSRPSTCAW
jgi:hypothetical protein